MSFHIRTDWRSPSREVRHLLSQVGVLLFQLGNLLSDVTHAVNHVSVHKMLQSNAQIVPQDRWWLPVVACLLAGLCPMPTQTKTTKPIPSPCRLPQVL